jgi:outer membrane lipoprotein SlyB
VPRVAAAPVAPPRVACGDCALVESIRVEPAPPRAGVLGAISGAIAGAIVGDQLAEAHRRHVMQALGALTGALLGRELELRQAPAPGYLVVLRLPDGSALERRYQQPPPFRAGDTVSLSADGTRSTRAAIF